MHARPQLLDDLPAELEGLHQLEAYVHEGRAATKPRSSSFTYGAFVHGQKTTVQNDSAALVYEGRYGSLGGRSAAPRWPPGARPPPAAARRRRRRAGCASAAPGRLSALP